MRQRTPNWLSFACERRRGSRFAALVPVLALAACAGGDGGWTRANTPPTDAAAALESCNGDIRAALDPEYGVDSDIIASRSTDWKRSGIYSMQRDQAVASSAELSDRLVAQCMIGKGFTQRPQ